MKVKIEENYCDLCGKKITCQNNLDIVTQLSADDSNYWSRLHVKIKHRHGYNNDAHVEDAELCKKCAIKLLADALKRVRAGERATKGAESSQQEGWQK